MVKLRTTIQHVPKEDLIKLEIAAQIEQFDKYLLECLKDDNFKLEDRELVYGDNFELNDNNNLDYHKMDINKTVECDDYDNATYDQILTAKIVILNK